MNETIVSSTSLQNNNRPQLNSSITQSSIGNPQFIYLNSTQSIAITDIKIIQINLNNCKAANEELLTYIYKEKIDIAIVQDYHRNNNSFTGLPIGWSIYQSKNRNAAILIINPKFYHLQALQLENSIFINLTINQQKPGNHNNKNPQQNISYIKIGSQYSKPSGDLTKDLQDWTDLLSDSEKLILGGDFNAHLRDWGYARNNARGDVLLDYLALNDLAIINDPENKYTFKRNNQKGNPDLTLCGLQTRELINSWKAITTHDSLSDHIYLVYQLHISPTLKQNYRYKTKHTNFYKFNQIFQNYYSNLLTELNNINAPLALDNWITDLQQILEFVMNISLRKKKIQYEIKLNWYTDKLKTQRNKLNAKHKRFIRNPDNATYREDYKKERAKYKIAIKKAKTEAWKSFCSTTRSCYGTAFKLLRQKYLKNTDLISTILETSKISDTYNNIENQLLSHHFLTNNQPEIVHEFINNQASSKEEFNEIKTSIREIKYCINLQNNKKAPGADNIDARVIKNLFKKFPDLLYNMYNKCLELNHFPTPWKKGLVIFFRKKNKDASKLEAYRPITLLPMLGKVLERIIKLRVMTYLESTTYLQEQQYGFREGRNTISALNNIITKVFNTLQSKKYCSMISFDIQAAFDTIDWTTISRIIDNSPLPQYLKNLLKNYISNRFNGLLQGSVISWFLSHRGCPQGSCLGPLLWLLIADFLLKSLQHIAVDFTVYADDFAVIAYGDTRSQLEQDANFKIKQFSQLCAQLGLTISKQKTTAILFGRNLLQNRHPIFKLQEQSISIKKNLTYLGLVLDSKLNFKDHLVHLKSKIQLFSSGFSKLNFFNKGINPSILKTWYNTVILRQILYGSEIWFPCINSHGLRKVNSIQRMALLGITRVYRSISNDALCVLTGCPPIQLILAKDLAQYNTMKGKRNYILQEITLSSTTLMMKSLSYTFPNYYKLRNLHILDDQTTSNNKNYEVTIFTDGSVMEKGTASAFTVLQNNLFIEDRSYRLHNLNTIYQAELFAILQAIEWFSVSNYTDLLLLSDSHSAVEALRLAFPRNYIIHQIFTILLNIPNKKVSIQWTKSHVGTEGNERADLLAKEAANNDSLEPIQLLFPTSLLKKALKSNLISNWQSSWSSSTKGRFTFKILNKVDPDFICKGTVIPYFLSGHGSFPSFLFKIGKKDSPDCPCGGTVGDPIHYIFKNCPLMKYSFRFNRNKTLRQNLKNILFNPVNYNKLRENYSILNKHFINFTYKCNDN